MQRLILTASFAFILGLTVGRFAIGQNSEPIVGAETQRSGKQDSAPITGIVQTPTTRSDSSILASLSDAAQAERNEQVDASSTITLGSMSEAEQMRVLLPAGRSWKAWSVVS